MSGKRAKIIRRTIDELRLPPEEKIKATKLIEGTRERIRLLNLIPKKIKPLSKKMHTRESWESFKDRRKVCNKRRRERELLRRS